MDTTLSQYRVSIGLFGGGMHGTKCFKHFVKTMQRNLNIFPVHSQGNMM